MISPADVLTFWFEELNPEDWFEQSDAVDQVCASRFSDLLNQAKQGELYTWRRDLLGRVAEIIVLDQFSRNIYRGETGAFTADPTALVLAQEVVASGEDAGLTPQHKQFLYMPYMHSESLLVHEEAIRLFSQDGLEHVVDYAHRHRDIIVRFGRYPHRNAILDRTSTEAEIAFLQTEGSSF